ncbi:uncharacterized protein [Glycine max]|uniref:uncharacterized protein n=1 Tax=Glycine max TaxID=3847 RepID=UPI0003DEA6BA|nr:uncharacterized protein LOC100783499 [Glycine max]|eukprot:XP_006605064.1 uncharacterized protein LOC100783499 [Glycine max]
MLIIIDQYKEKVNLAASHGHMLEDEQAKVLALRVEREAREGVIELLHKEAMKWMDRFALTLNESPELPRLLARAKAVANTYSTPDKVQSKHPLPPYGLPSNYTLPNVEHAPDENVHNSTPIPIEIQQPQYATKEQAFGCVPLPNALEGPQYRPQSQLQPLHFVVGRLPPAMVEREKFDHIEERLRAIEGDEDYPFADMEELCLVPDIIIPLKFKVPDFNKYKGTTCPKNHLKMYCRKMGAYAKDEKLLMHFFKRVWLG